MAKSQLFLIRTSYRQKTHYMYIIVRKNFWHVHLNGQFRDLTIFFSHRRNDKNSPVLRHILQYKQSEHLIFKRSCSVRLRWCHMLSIIFRVKVTPLSNMGWKWSPIFAKLQSLCFWESLPFQTFGFIGIHLLLFGHWYLLLYSGLSLHMD